MPGQLPPSNPEAEAYVLGCILRSRNAAERAAALLQPDAFHLDAHRQVFANSAALLERQTPPDPGLVAEELRKQGLLERYGGMAWLDSLAAGVTGPALVEHYAEIVRQKSVLRKLIEIGAALIDAAYAGEVAPEELQSRALAQLEGLAARRTAPDPFTGVELASVTHDAIFGRGEERPLLSHWRNLNRITGGMPEDLVIIAGRPSMGKSALSLAMALGMAQRGEPVLYLSLETPAGTTMKRSVACRSGIRLERLRPDSSLSGSELQRINAANDWIAGLPIHLHDEAGLTVQQIRELTRRMKAKHGIRALFIDQLPLIARSEKSENENLALGRIATALQILARTERLPVILLHQLSRNVERRDNKRPQLTDLRESGAIEERSGLVLLLYRESYYRSREAGEPEPDESWLEVAVAKQREGSTGTLKFFYLLPTQEITEVDKHHDERDAPPDRKPYADE